MAAGRPTKYDPKFCEDIIQHFSEGGNIESFAGYINVSKQSIYHWLDAHPEFLDARRIAQGKSAQFYNKIGIGLMTGKLKGNATAWVMTQKNCFGWRDRIETSETEADKFRTPANLLPEA